MPLDKRLYPWVLGLSWALVLVSYTLLHQRYRFENIDDAWTLAWAHTWWVHGERTERVFGSTGTGLTLFGLLYGWLYGLVGMASDWTKSAAHLTSTTLVAASAALWAMALHTWGFSRRFCALYAAVFLLAEPLFGAANQARTDALALFWTACAVLAASRGGAFLTGLFTLLAFETHPAGGLHALFLGGGVLLWRLGPIGSRPWKNKALRISALQWALGAALGAAVFAALHWDSAQNLGAVLSRGRSLDGYTIPNYLFSYFFLTRHLRHLPELLIIVATLILAIRQRLVQQQPLPALLLLSAFVASIGLGRANYHYTAHFYPVVLLFVLAYGSRWKGPAVIALGMALYWGSQYGWLILQTRHLNFEAQVSKLRAAVPDDDLPILGAPNDWFTFQTREFRALPIDEGQLQALSELNRGFYLIRNDSTRTPETGTLVENILRRSKSEPIERFMVNGLNFSVDRVDREI